MAAPTLKIFFHNHCFDGASSAALFAEFYRSQRNPDATIAFRGMSHHKGDPFDSVAIDGDENACVDFRYCKNPRMNWWFDHHISGFQPPSLKEDFESSAGGKKFFDPSARSCALFMLKVLEEQFSFRPEDPHGHWHDLLQWADRIDGAVFESAKEIVELKSPALRVMTWLRGCRDSAAIVELIPKLGRMSLAEIESLPLVADILASLLKNHERSIELVEKRLAFDGCVASYDLSRDEIQSHSGFAAYMLCPEATYSVALSRSAEMANISIGRNPWAKTLGSHNIARICEEYGGGGHPHVGGIAVPAKDMQRAREIVEEVRLALQPPA